MKERIGKFYRSVTWITRTILNGTLGYRIEGTEHVPRSGGVLIVSNHLSWMDPMILSGAAPFRQFHYMAKQELFENRWTRPLVQTLGAFPVDRGSVDRKALRTAFDLLEKGRIVALFPEGTRGKAPLPMQPWHGGAGMIALKANVEVVPAVLLNTRQVLEELGRSFRPVRVRFGPRLNFGDLSGGGKQRLVEIQQRCEAAVAGMLAEMLEEERRGRV